MQKKTYLIGSFVFAAALSGVSVIIYVQGTSGAPFIVKFCSIGSNYLVGVLAGKETCDYYKEVFAKADTETLHPRSRKARIIGAAIITLYSIVLAAPFAIATYNLTNSHLATKICLGIAVLLGSGSLNVFSAATLVQDMQSLYYLSINAVRSSYAVRCFTDAEEFSARRDLYLVRNHVLAQINAFNVLLRKRSINKVVPNLALSDGTLIERFNRLCDAYSLNFCTEPKSWPRVCLEYGVLKILLGIVLIGTGMLIGDVGYTCDTSKTINNWGVTNIAMAWLLGNLVMSSLYILNFTGAVRMVMSFYEYITERTKPLVWRALGGFGFIPLILMAYAAGALSFKSGYTAVRLFKQCPHEWQSSASNYMVDYATVSFNSLYVLFSLNLLALIMLRLCGKEKQKALLEQLSLLDSVRNEFDGNLEEFGADLLQLVDDNQLTVKSKTFLIGAEGTPSRNAFDRFTLFAQMRKPLLSSANAVAAPRKDNHAALFTA